MGDITLTSILTFGNLILAAVNVIVGFALLVYILTHNLRSPVAQAFCVLMALVIAVFVVDITMPGIDSLASVNAWLRVQWVGIAFVPAAYYHFSDALLRTTGAKSRMRRVGVFSTYALGLAVLLMVALSDLLVDGVSQKQHIYHLLPGPLFWVFSLYYVAITASGWMNVRMAWQRCLTSTSRRRMSYLMLAYVAPVVGVFPFLVVPSTGQHLSANMISLLNLLGDLGIALMTIVIGYIVAYQGVLLPDRVVKHSLIHYLLRGPLVASLVIAVMLTIPKVEHILGLPRDTILTVAVVASVVLLQLLISVFKPGIDRLIYRRDRKEIALIQTLDQRLLTTTDLEQLLENTLIAICEQLRARAGFVVTMQSSKLSLRVFCGRMEEAARFLEHVDLSALMEELSKSRKNGAITNEDLVRADGHWLLPLRSAEHTTLGLLGISASGLTPTYGEEELSTLYRLARRLERALEDMQLQQQVFGVLQSLESELDQIQAWRSRSAYASVESLERLETNPIHSPGFAQAVKDALSQLWGGPKLSQSPLARMRVVRERLDENGNVPAKAVRSVLQEAIDRLKPSGQRSMTAGEWVLYNILDLRFVQGERIRDIAQRMAMSESDFYRKQRVAVDQVTQTLIQMERASQEQKSAN